MQEFPVSKTSHIIPFDTIDNGKPYTFALGKESDNAGSVTIKGNGDSYTLQIGSDSQNTTKLRKEQIPAYVESLDFIEKLGLGYFIKKLPINTLSTLLNNTSKGDIHVDHKDKNFDESEKMKVLLAFGKLLDIPGTDTIQNSEDGPALFH